VRIVRVESGRRRIGLSLKLEPDSEQGDES